VTMQSKQEVKSSLSVLILVMIVVFSLGVGPKAVAADEQQTLAGLFGVEVVVENMDRDIERDGITEKSLQTTVELRLRQAGIRILSNTERLRAPGNPYLYLDIQTLKDRNENFYAYSIELKLNEIVRLDRNPNVMESATTWHARGRIGLVGVQRLQALRRSVGEMVNQFINAYLAANPKR